nr:hypothetical protein [Streptomyces antibioticus]
MTGSLGVGGRDVRVFGVLSWWGGGRMSGSLGVGGRDVRVFGVLSWWGGGRMTGALVVDAAAMPAALLFCVGGEVGV